MSLTLRVEKLDRLDPRTTSIPNLARFAHYIGVVAQINGSLIETVTINGRAPGPESTSPDGTMLELGANHLPPMGAAKPTAMAAWCGVALHGFAHSRYSPRPSEPLRAIVHKKGMHRTWNMIEDARIELSRVQQVGLRVKPKRVTGIEDAAHEVVVFAGGEFIRQAAEVGAEVADFIEDGFA